MLATIDQMLKLMLCIDGSCNKRVSLDVQPGDGYSRRIYHHHSTVYNVQINVVQHKSEQLSFDADSFASKLFKCIATI